MAPCDCGWCEECCVDPADDTRSELTCDDRGNLIDDGYADGSEDDYGEESFP